MQEVSHKNPPELDIVEIAAKLLHQPQALLVALGLQKGKAGARNGRGTLVLLMPPASPAPALRPS